MTALRIAIRYLFSRKQHNAVNVISLISAAGIMVATMAIVVVLSVFNGFTQLAMDRLGLLDPDVKVEPATGMTIANGDSLAGAIATMSSTVSHAIPVIEHQALAVYDRRQTPVRLKGVPVEAYDSVTGFASTLIAGMPLSAGTYGMPGASLSVGTANTLRALVSNGTGPWLGLYAPKRLGRINPANPMSAFLTDSVEVTSVFRIDQAEYDADYIITDINVTRHLFSYTTQASAIEIKLKPDTDTQSAIRELNSRLGPDYTVKSRVQQQAQSFRMIQVEKWITFMLLGFILVIASFNIISTLSMLIIDKEGSIATLRALGASQGMLRRIFAIQGWLITMAGGLLGALAGVILSLIQEHYGIIRLGGDPAAMSITTYPVHVQASDLIVVTGLLIIIGAVTCAVSVRSVRNN